MRPFQELDVSEWARDREEPTGQSAKHWLRSPEDGTLWLFKSRKRPPNQAHGTDWSGDDWAEKVSAELYALVGVPHAQVELARDSRYSTDVDPHGLGVVARSLVPADSELVLGNEYLASLDPRYPKDLNRGAFYMVSRVLDSLRHMTGAGGQHTGAVTDFVGFLMMDALTCAADRNHTNWGMLRTGNAMSLAPSFDHGSSLGWELQDSTREAALHGRKPTKAPVRYVQSNEGVFADENTTGRRIGTLDAFKVALRAHPESARGWLARLNSISVGRLTGVIGRVPHGRISIPASEYAAALVNLSYGELAKLLT